jgi:lysophospholipase L1-like esterase
MNNQKTIILIGDSITEGFNVRQLLKERNILNYGVSGDSTVECLERISDQWFEQSIGIVYLCIGTNDLVRDRTDQEIFENIRMIVEQVRKYSPDTMLKLTSLFPTRDNPPRPNERIRTFNAGLKQLSIALNTGYADIHHNFVDEHGDLQKEFTEDGLHLTDAAYRRWAEILLAEIGIPGA